MCPRGTGAQGSALPSTNEGLLWCHLWSGSKPAGFVSVLRRNSGPEGFEKAEYDAAVAVAYWGIFTDGVLGQLRRTISMCLFLQTSEKLWVNNPDRITEPLFALQYHPVPAKRITPRPTVRCCWSCKGGATFVRKPTPRLRMPQNLHCVPDGDAPEALASVTNKLGE